MFMRIQGVVVHGKKEARTLGYPTANLEYAESTNIEHGVWTCWVMINGARHQGLAVIGMWRLAQGVPSAEVHILDFHQDIYGETLEVILGERLRPLEAFEDLEKLKRQIEQDVHQARKKLLS
jgi:riboflavin kinase/FMN adenylyltransferase